MKLWCRVKSAWRNLFHRNQVERQLNTELHAYLDLVTGERIASGMPPSEARRTALVDFGGIEQVKEVVRAERAGVSLERAWLDAKYASRQLRRNSGFTITVILTLALSIGINTAVFSVVNALILKSLPYNHPELMGTIYTRVTGASASDERHNINGEQWELLRDNVPSLTSAISSVRTSAVNLRAGSEVRSVQAGRISAHYLDVLALRPLIGRNFLDLEDRVNGPKTAILSSALWRNTFNSDRTIAGHTILLKGEPYTVVGVLPDGAITPLNADIYTAIQGSRRGEGVGTNFQALTRLRDGASWQQSDAELNRAWSVRTRRYELEGDASAHVSYYSVPFQKGETARLRPQVLALMLAAGFILLIACANLAALNLARMLRRKAEFATRLALGASHWQLQKQLWIENLLLAFVAGAAAMAVGFIALRILLVLLPEHFLPVADVSLDERVLMFTLAVSLFTSVLFGMLPALTTRRFDLRSAMASRTATFGDRLRLRQSLIVGEVALTTVLLACSGFLIRTLVQLQTLPAGFRPSGVMTARASLDDARYHDAPAFRKLLAQSTAAMRQIPSVDHAAVGLSLPYERSLNTGGISISNGKEAGHEVMADEVYVTPDYFAALQIPIVAGRSFNDADGPTTQHVAIVNRSFAAKYFHGANPIGRYLMKDTVIVGMVDSVKIVPGFDSVAPLSDEQTMYIPASQMPARQLALLHVWFQPSWIVRTAVPIEGLGAQMQRALSSVDPNLPFSGFYRMSDLLAKALSAQRVEVALLGSIASLALFLTAVGIFALIANIVTQKTRELGLHLALGSTVSQAMLQIGAPGIQASGVGLVIGLGLSELAMRAMRSVVFGLEIYDAWTILAVILSLALVAFAATVVPTLRVAGIDPARTLRDE